MTDAELSTALAEASEFLRARNFAAAERAARALIDAGAEHPHAMHVLGLALTQLNRYDEALLWLKRSADAAPNAGIYAANLATALWDAGDTRGALAAFDRAVTREPENLRAWDAYAAALLYIGHAQGAAAALGELLKRDPNSVAVRSRLLAALIWDPPADPAALGNLHAAFARSVTPPPAPPTVPPTVPPAPGITFSNTPQPDRTLHVAYLLPPGASESIAPFLEPILSRHDPEQIVAACYTDDPRSTPANNSMREQVTRWVDISPLSNGQLLDLLRADQADIVVDLGGHAATRMGALARHAAPVQASYWGYPCPTQMPTVPFRISDAVCEPPRPDEPPGIVRLAPCAVAYRPARNRPEPGPLPALRSKRITFGAMPPPPGVTRRVAATWARVLRAVPDSRLIVILDADAGDAARERIAGLLQADPFTTHRVIVESPADPLPLFEQIDIALDTFPCSDPARVCEALWMGLPVITLAAGPLLFRSASVITAAGLPDCVASDEDGFIAAAKKLAASPVQLAALRRTLRARMRNSELLKEGPLTKRLESAYRTLWRAWCEGRHA